MSCFDVFDLTLNLFKPNGKLEPGEKYGKADQGFFPLSLIWMILDLMLS
tara:strand:- start:2 stop:148 length:147 start_codon:yes stop_codon:yes gene_type:complete